ncbi:MAG: M13 family metallopeptidase [Flavobacteriales bacterium]|nr:M13 family metallopeptidase [Flavobacteriales bacterium]
MKKYLLPALLFAAILSSMKSDKNNNPVAFDLNNLDKSISPCDNFYKYAIGNWQKLNPVPSTEGRWMSFNILDEENRKKVQGILDEALATKNPKKGSDLQLIKDFYTSALDSNSRKEKGLKAIQPLLEAVNGINTLDDLSLIFGKLRTYGITTPVAFYVGRDDKNSEQYVVNAGQSGLSMGDKSYYLKDEKKYEIIRKGYSKHVAKIFKLAKVKAKSIGKNILDIETEIAKISWDRQELRDADKTYNKMAVADFDNKLVNLNIRKMIETMGMHKVDSLVVGPVSYYEKLDNVVSKINLNQWKDYLKWQILSQYAPHLGDDFEKENFNFFATTMQGVKEMKPRKERILRVVDGRLGEPIGKIYVEKYFPQESKEYMTELIENLRDAYRESIINLTWMGDETKVKALKKLESFSYKIGYPNKWKDYTQLDITADNYLQNLMNSSLFGFEMMTDKLGKPVDKDEWFMTPHQVNAYYNRSGNEIVFPAGILQPPFFHPTFDHAINYGGIGGVIGHEFTHGFDDQGSKYDWDGNKNDWWTDEDRKQFDALTTKLAEQYSKYEVLPGEFVNGRLTLGENIADLGGITLSYMACEKVMSKQKDQMVDGFTWQQRFFLGWANVWKGNITDETLRNRINTDPHSPAEQRVLGPLANLPQFEEAFGCHEKPMMKADTARIKIW